MNTAKKGLEAEVTAALGTRKRAPRDIWIGLALVAALTAGVMLGAAMSPGGSDPIAQEKAQYTCGMHPEIVQDEPGYCPICGMKLTPAKAGKRGKKKIITGVASCRGKEILYYQAPMDPNYRSPSPGKSPMGMDLVPACESDEEETAGGISVDPRIRQNMGIRTEAVKKGPLVKHIRTVAHVDYDERRLAIINTKIDGWVEKLYVDYTGQRVKKGQRLLSLYSPKLVSTQEELLLALRQYRVDQNARNSILVQAAERRLRYWDISPRQIEHIKQSGKVQKNLAIYSLIDGVVVHKNIVEGKFVKAGMDLFRIADLSRVWMYAHIYEMDAPFVKEGQPVEVELSYGPTVKIPAGKVDYIFPWLDRKTRDIKARLVFDNPQGYLKPEMYANVTIKADLDREALLVDSSAVIRSGVRNVIFVETGPGTYQPRTVDLGVELNGSVEITGGVREGEFVVVNGQFMLDSESRLKEALQKYEKTGGENREAGDPLGELEELEDKGCTFTCPMPEHFHVCDKGPGECPECGMSLKPIGEVKRRLGG
jgi:Cu(I)/Ag(I) efflux system membrane fusion protein/cobalt-zinc-cadmium efflux system membrane fusion protein